MTFSDLSATALCAAALCVSPSHGGQVRDYEWCLPRDGGGNMDCMYSTYQQCFATASGLGGGGCIQNPTFTFSRRPEAKKNY
jgi:hypothetical protein